jgi:hypothetical protein
MLALTMAQHFPFTAIHVRLAKSLGVSKAIVVALLKSNRVFPCTPVPERFVRRQLLPEHARLPPILQH